MSDKYYMFRSAANPKQSYWIKAPQDEAEIQSIKQDAEKIKPKLVDPAIEADAARIRERLQPTKEERDELMEDEA